MQIAANGRNPPFVLDIPRHAAPSTNVVEGLILLKNSLARKMLPYFGTSVSWMSIRKIIFPNWRVSGTVFRQRASNWPNAEFFKRIGCFRPFAAVCMDGSNAQLLAFAKLWHNPEADIGASCDESSLWAHISGFLWCNEQPLGRFF